MLFNAIKQDRVYCNMAQYIKSQYRAINSNKLQINVTMCNRNDKKVPKLYVWSHNTSSIVEHFFQGKGTITTYFLVGYKGFDKPLPSLKKAAGEEEHIFK